MQSKTSLNYELSGNGETVVLIHGLFGDLDNLKGIGRELEQHYQVLYLDMRNHGQSFHSDTMTYAAMAGDVFQLLDQLNIHEAHFLGHSMGGKVVMECALTEPKRVLSVIAADIAPVAYDARHHHILDALNAVDMSQVHSRKDADKQLQAAIPEAGVRQFLLKNLATSDAGFDWRFNLKALTEHYEQINGAVRKGHYDGPILFIKGGNSDYLTTQHESEIRDRFSQIDVKVIADTGHWLHAEKPHIFNRLVTGFLEQQSRA